MGTTADFSSFGDMRSKDVLDEGSIGCRCAQPIRPNPINITKTDDRLFEAPNPCIFALFKLRNITKYSGLIKHQRIVIGSQNLSFSSKSKNLLVLVMIS
jgi:hypothetical protein